MDVFPHQIKSLGRWDSSGEQSPRSALYIPTVSQAICRMSIKQTAMGISILVVTLSLHILILGMGLHLYLNSRCKCAMLCSRLQSFSVTTKSCWRLTGKRSALQLYLHNAASHFHLCHIFYKQMFSGCTEVHFIFYRAAAAAAEVTLMEDSYVISTQTIISDLCYCKPWIVPVCIRKVSALGVSSCLQHAWRSTDYWLMETLLSIASKLGRCHLEIQRVHQSSHCSLYLAFTN